MKITQIQAYAKLFGINERAARDRIKKANPEPYEKFFRMLQPEEIISLIEYIESENSSIEVAKTDRNLVIKLTKNRNDTADIEDDSSHPKYVNMKISGITFQFNKKTTKSKQLIIHEWHNQNTPFDDDANEEDDEFETFEEQEFFLSEEAYRAYFDGATSDKVALLEAEYLTKLQPNNDPIFVGNYENFITGEYRLQHIICKQIFENRLDEIQLLPRKKEVLDFLINQLFPTEFALNYIAEMCSMPTIICKQLAIEAFEKLYTEKTFFS